MTNFLNSTSTPKFQHRASQIDLPFPGSGRNSPNFEDPILPLWRTWRETALHEAEMARRGRLTDDCYHLAWSAGVRAFEILGAFPGYSPVAIAARLHAAFHHAYAGASALERRDPVYRAQVTVLRGLVPLIPEEIAAEIEHSLGEE